MEKFLVVQQEQLTHKQTLQVRLSNKDGGLQCMFRIGLQPFSRYKNRLKTVSGEFYRLR